MCDDGRPKISLEDRLSVIAGTFAQAYFGHAPTSAAIWSELERYCDALLAADDSISRSQLLQRQLCGVVDDHPLNAFPVSRRQRFAAVEWTARLLHRQSLEIGARVCFVYESLRCLTAELQIWAEGPDRRSIGPISSLSTQLRDLMNELDGDEDEPEYIFKTFHRGGDESVTILEENRNIIGHGTTGLT